MKSRTPKFIAFAAVAVLSLSMVQTALTGCSACKRKLGKTQIVVEDSIRHYYPMLQGTKLIMPWHIGNAGDEPLVLSDIQPSCGCIIADPQDSYVIPPGKELILKFTYDSSKNSGYVRHTIRLFGNIAPNGMSELVFDTNVVPPAQASPDYEERYMLADQFDVMAGVKELVDGSESERGYWIDKGEYSRGYRRYPWREGRTDD